MTRSYFYFLSHTFVEVVDRGLLEVEGDERGKDTRSSEGILGVDMELRKDDLRKWEKPAV